MTKEQAWQIAKQAKSLKEITEAYKKLKRARYLNLLTKEGRQLFNILVAKGYQPIKDPDKFNQLVEEAQIKDYINDETYDKFKDSKVLRIANNQGWTVAHELASEYNPLLPDNLSAGILLMRDNNGTTVAHCLTEFDYDFGDVASWVYRVADNYGWTVAHAGSNYLPYEFLTDAELMQLRDKDKVSVIHTVASNHLNIDQVIAVIKDHLKWLYFKSNDPKDTVAFRLLNRIDEVADPIKLLKIIHKDLLLEALKQEETAKKVINTVTEYFLSSVFG